MKNRASGERTLRNHRQYFRFIETIAIGQIAEGADGCEAIVDLCRRALTGRPFPTMQSLANEEKRAAARTARLGRQVTL